MNPWIAKAVILAASIVLVAIRAPHGQRSSAVKIVKDRKVRLEVALLVLAMLGPELQRTECPPSYRSLARTAFRSPTAAI
jgi:hypothetical protein